MTVPRHPITRVYDPGKGSGRHYIEGKRCFCHGHCGTCDAPVVMNKVGRFVHVDEYPKHRYSFTR